MSLFSRFRRKATSLILPFGLIGIAGLVYGLSIVLKFRA